MALINCPQCGKQVSDKAERCIHCNCLLGKKSNAHKQEKKQKAEKAERSQKKKGWKRFLLIFAVMLAVVAVAAIVVVANRKVVQKETKIEAGSTFDIERAFTCKKGVQISLKAGNTIDTQKIGKATAEFVIQDGKKEKEHTYSFDIVDTTPPVIDTGGITIYQGADFKPEEIIMCTDNSGEDISVSVTENTVDTDAAGTYSITCQAKDSSGNQAEAVVQVEVRSIETMQDALDLADEYIVKKGYAGFADQGDDTSGFILCPDLESKAIDSNRKLSISPRIQLLQVTGKPGVSSFIIYMSLRDESPSDKRYTLYADKLKFISGNQGFTNNNGDITSGSEFERNYYTSKFHYSLNKEEIDQLEKMLDTGTLQMEVQTTNLDYELPSMKKIETPVSLVCELSESDIEIMKQAIDIYQHLYNIMGEWGIGIE